VSHSHESCLFCAEGTGNQGGERKVMRGERKLMEKAVDLVMGRHWRVLSRKII
jgi:hypothetical protein